MVGSLQSTMDKTKTNSKQGQGETDSADAQAGSDEVIVAVSDNMADDESDSITDKEWEQANKRDVVDVRQLSPKILALSWWQYQLREFWFADLHFYLETHANLKRTYFRIDHEGFLRIKIQPTEIWSNIVHDIIDSYRWLKKHQQAVLQSYDYVSYELQKRRQFSENDLIYVWGLPYFLHIELGAEEEGIELHEPQQLMFGRVPKGQARYSERFFALQHKGYFDREAVSSLPWSIDGRLALPKKCIWHDMNCMNINGIDRHQYNAYYSAFLQAMQQCLDDWHHQRLFASNFLNSPAWEMFNHVLNGFYYNLILKNPKLTFSDWNEAATTACLRLSTLTFGAFSESIVHDNHCKDYAIDLLLPPDYPKAVATAELLSFAWQQNLQNPAGIRQEVPPARLSSPPLMSYAQLPDELRLCDILWQRALYAMPNTQGRKEAEERGVYASLDGTETALFGVDGVEVDPTLAMVAYLPDNAISPNTKPQDYTYEQVSALSGATFGQYYTYENVAGYYKIIDPPLFHRTLVKPNALTLKIKSKTLPAPKKIQQLLRGYLDQEMYTAAQHYMNMIRPMYESRRNIVLYNLENKGSSYGSTQWIDQLEVRKMKALGQYYYFHDRASIRLNQRLVHYPPIIMASVLNHEMCHMVYLDHGDDFKQLLGILAPAAEVYIQYMNHMGILSV